MFKAEEYISALTELLKKLYCERLLYVGLQGSYLRGEATEDSDIDIMAVIENMTVKDLDEYRKAIMSLGGYDKSCGFICGADELKNWNPLEICHLLHTTKDYFGELSKLVPEYTQDDVHSFVKLSLGNLYHEICHRYIHAPKEKSVSDLPYTYKAVFFILQNLHWLKTGMFINSKQELVEALSGKDKLVLEKAISLSKGAHFEFDEAFELLFSWCKEALANI